MVVLWAGSQAKCGQNAGKSNHPSTEYHSLYHIPMNVFIFLDRRATTDGTYPVKIRITHQHGKADIPTDIRVTAEQYKDGRIVKHPLATTYNAALAARRSAIESQLLAAPPAIRDKSATELRDWAVSHADGTADDNPKALFVPAYNDFMASRDAKRTREIYQTTLNRLREYDKRLDNLTFDDITPRWLDAFDRHLAKASPSVNARNIHMRNIRAVCNYALDNDITTYYPFRRYKLRYTETDKRAITAEELRAFFRSAPPGRGGKACMDMMMLIYMLIGINVTDLWGLAPDAVRQGRLHYRRAKTGKLYSIKVEPEVAALLDAYQGRTGLLRCRDEYVDPHSLIKRLDKWSKRINPQMTTYVLRHTWATIAYNDLGVSKEVISMALGHEIGSKVTSVYIKPDLRLVDEANRRMIDYIFGVS